MSPIIPIGYTPNYLEQTWFNLFQGGINPSIKLTVIIFMLHQIVYYLGCLPYIILDHVPSFKKYKLQPDQTVSRAAFRNVFTYVILVQLLVLLPVTPLIKPVTETLGMKFFEAPLPSVSSIFFQCTFFVIVEDMLFYWGHRALHWGILYKYIHKHHHKYHVSFGIDAEYVSLSDALVLGVGFFLGPVIWSVATMGDSDYSLHVVSFLAWLSLRTILNVNNHIGYDFPWSIRHWVPFWAGAEFHDYHHEKFVGNYASTFRFWDWIAGTDVGYTTHRAALKQMNKSVKSD
ncbi:hypothetical protein BDR26DRAFT_806273 [Obelidium mucronatum]|nr:hypothetical protein BDR26DRAFT_806273 [Obelidium mucronatum]